MRQPSFLRRFSRKAVALSLLTVAACASAQATVVFDNLQTSASNGPTLGNYIGAAVTTGPSAFALTDVVFPQINGTTDQFTDGENFTLHLSNADGTIGATIPVSFTLSNVSSHAPAGQVDSFGQTTATAAAPIALVPGATYWYVLTAPTQTAWSYSTNTAFTSNYGFSFPTTNTAYEAGGPSNNGDGIYFNLSDGPQLININGVVPEPSSYCLMAIAGVATLVLVRRVRQAKAA